MKNMFFLISMTFIVFACKQKQTHSNDNPTKKEAAQMAEIDIPSLNYKQLKPWLNKEDNKTYVVNFWATWCAPCVKELPYFEKLGEDYKDKNVEVILVSLDFPKKKASSLIPFVEKQNIQSQVLHLNDTNEQFWIDDIAKSWSGAIPATLIYNKDKRQFYEQSFTQEDLENEVQSFIN